jgi:uncharacterized protein YjiS (DUF1127 family)
MFSQTLSRPYILSARPSWRQPLSWLMASVDAWRSRRQLESLDAHLLHDIGISKIAAHAEAKRPIWDVPAHWLQ